MLLLGQGVGHCQKIQFRGKNGNKIGLFAIFSRFFRKFGGENELKCWFIQLGGVAEKKFSSVDKSSAAQKIHQISILFTCKLKYEVYPTGQDKAVKLMHFLCISAWLTPGQLLLLFLLIWRYMHLKISDFYVLDEISFWYFLETFKGCWYTISK